MSSFALLLAFFSAASPSASAQSLVGAENPRIIAKKRRHDAKVGDQYVYYFPISSREFARVDPGRLASIPLLGRGVYHREAAENLTFGCVGKPDETSGVYGCEAVRLMYWSQGQVYFAGRPVLLRSSQDVRTELSAYLALKFKGAGRAGRALLERALFNWADRPVRISKNLFAGTLAVFNRREIELDGFAEEFGDSISKWLAFRDAYGRKDYLEVVRLVDPDLAREYRGSSLSAEELAHYGQLFFEIGTRNLPRYPQYPEQAYSWPVSAFLPMAHYLDSPIDLREGDGSGPVSN